MSPPTWVPGQVLTASDVNTWLVPPGNVKTIDHPVTSSTVLVNDVELVLAVGASSTYRFDCFLDWEAAAGGDIKWQWVIPAGASLLYTYSGVGGTVGSGTQTIAGAGGGVLRGTTMSGTLVVASTAGSLQFQFAQNTSNATSTIVHAQSGVYLQRIT